MIQKARVRRAPITGLGGHERKHTSVVYLNEEWRGETVVVIPVRQYTTLLHQIKAKKLHLEIRMLKDRLFRIRRIAV